MMYENYETAIFLHLYPVKWKVIYVKLSIS